MTTTRPRAERGAFPPGAAQSGRVLATGDLQWAAIACWSPCLYAGAVLVADIKRVD